MKVLNLLFCFFLLSSCSGVIKRNNYGRMPRKEPRKHFSGIKKKVVLLEIFNESPVGGSDLGIVATEELRKEMTRVGEFIIDPLGKRIFGSSKEIYSGGGLKLVQLSRKAKVSGFNLVIFGRIIEARVREKSDEIGIIRQTKSYTESKVEIRIFDVNSKKEILTRTIRGYADDLNYRFFVSDRESKMEYRKGLLRYAVKVAIRKFVPSIMEISAKMDWVGRVAKIIDNKIYINAGRDSGIQVSDILKVVTEGEEIYDPETGALIGVSQGDTKGTVEIIDYFAPDGAIAILHSGGAVLEGDFVQLY